MPNAVPATTRTDTPLPSSAFGTCHSQGNQSIHPWISCDVCNISKIQNHWHVTKIFNSFVIVLTFGMPLSSHYQDHHRSLAPDLHSTPGRLEQPSSALCQNHCHSQLPKATGHHQSEKSGRLGYNPSLGTRFLPFSGKIRKNTPKKSGNRRQYHFPTINHHPWSDAIAMLLVIINNDYCQFDQPWQVDPELQSPGFLPAGHLGVDNTW